MSKNLYITTTAPQSGRSLVSFGIFEILLKKNDSVGFFRPILNDDELKQKHINYILKYFNSKLTYEDTYAMTRDEALELLQNGAYDKFLETILAKYKALEEKCSFILCEGTSYSDKALNPFELHINADIAKNIAATVLIVTNAIGLNAVEIEAVTNYSNALYKELGCNVLGNIVNRADETIIDEVLKRVPIAMAKNNMFFALIPENTSKNKRYTSLLKTFRQHVQTKDLEKAIDSGKPPGLTYKMFEFELLGRAKAKKQHIVLPEGDDERTLQAAEMLKARDIVELTILGNKQNINESIDKLGLNLDGITIIDPQDSAKHSEYAQELFEIRKHKGLTLDQSKELMYDVTYYATMMLHLGEVDGMVSGAAHTTGETIRPALQIIKTKENCSIVSSIFLMCLEGRIAAYGDCAVNPNPTAEQLAEIAISSADTAQAFGIEPKVALLSYSSGASGAGPDVEKVAKATEIAKKLRPDLMIEGPIQYDAAVVPEVGASKMPGSKVAGKATVLVFPDLNTGNNTYKAVQRESGAEAIGPVLQGIKKPVNDLSRGCSVLDIVNTTIITAIQAQSDK